MKPQTLAIEEAPIYLGFAEKVHKTNLGGRELME
ncbi:hypothetical protein KR51_00029070, partial [Rubidibacter lacunae KORDI 51-2]